MHRVIFPGQALGRHAPVVDIQTTHPKFLSYCLDTPVLIVMMVADPVIASIMDARKRRGLATAYEISDDFKAFPSRLPSHAFYQCPDVQALIESLAQQADLLQFSSHFLCRKYGYLNANTSVFMNQLADIPALVERNAEHRGPAVLGWAGSLGHREDAGKLARWLHAWKCSRQDKNEEPPRIRVMAANDLVAVFRQSDLQIDACAPGDFSEYLKFLSSIDIGIALVGDDDFSQGRSDGKFLEYASRGVVCVASRQGPYEQSMVNGETGLLFSTERQFIAALDQVYDKPELRESIRHAAHQLLRRERTHALAALHRKQVYGQLMSQVGAGGICGDTQPAEEASTRFVSLADSSEETLRHAMVLHARGRLTEALQTYLAVLEGHPGFFLPWQQTAMLVDAMGLAENARYFNERAAELLKTALATGS